jgi:hypothetical protein
MIPNVVQIWQTAIGIAEMDIPATIYPDGAYGYPLLKAWNLLKKPRLIV